MMDQQWPIPKKGKPKVPKTKNSRMVAPSRYGNEKDTDKKKPLSFRIKP